MLKTILAAALIVANLSTQALAADKVCKSLGDLAQTIMLKRQMGVTMSKIMAAADTGDGDEQMTHYTEFLIRQAYDMPRFDTEKYQADAILDFRNVVESACYKARQ